MGNHAELVIRLPRTDIDPTMLNTVLTAASATKESMRHFAQNMIDRSLEAGGGIIMQARGCSFSTPTGRFDCAQASATVGDTIVVTTPDGVTSLLVAVAASPNVSAGQWLIGASNSAMATNIAAALNGLPATQRFYTVTTSTATVIITARSDKRSQNNSYWSAIESNTSATTLTSTPTLLGSLASGVTVPTMDPTMTNTITISVNPTANDTLRFSNVVLTWVASAANENQITIGGNAAASTNALAAAINAHSILGKFITAASDAVSVVTNTWIASDILSYMTYMVGTGSNPGTISGQFTLSTITPVIGGVYKTANIP